MTFTCSNALNILLQFLLLYLHTFVYLFRHACVREWEWWSEDNLQDSVFSLHHDVFRISSGCHVWQLVPFPTRLSYFLSEKLLHRSWYCKGGLMSMCIALFPPENFLIFPFIFKWWPFDGNIISWCRFIWVHHFGNFTFLSKSDGCFSVVFLPFFLPFLKLVLCVNGSCEGCPLSIITLSTRFYFLYQGDIKLPVLLLPELSSWWILLLKPFSN